MTGLLYGGSTQILAQLTEVVAIFVTVFGLSYLFFKLLAALKLLRVTPEVEMEGLDMPEMGSLAYPVDWEPAKDAV